MITHFLFQRTRLATQYPVSRAMNVVHGLVIIAAILALLGSGCGRDVPYTVESLRPDLGPSPDLSPTPDLTPTVPTGTLKIRVSTDTPAITNHLMGTVDQYPGVFTLCADPVEAIRVQEVIVSLWHNGEGAIRLPTNIRLIDRASGAHIGAAVAQFSTVVNGQEINLPQYGHAVFSNLTYGIPRGLCLDIGVQMDFVTYESGGFTTTGQQLVPAILTSYTNTPGQNATVTAVGVTSGRAIPSTVVASPAWAKVPGAYGNVATLYRTKLLTMWSADTPTGMATPGTGQVIAKLVITNLANSGTYPSAIEAFNVNLATTTKPLTARRVLTIYKDSLATTPVATHTFMPGQTLSGNTAITAANFTTVQIASGASKTFYVTLDTSEAMGGTSLSVRVNNGGGTNGGIDWNDGVSQRLNAMGADLPLTSKSFAY